MMGNFNQIGSRLGIIPYICEWLFGLCKTVQTPVQKTVSNSLPH